MLSNSLPKDAALRTRAQQVIPGGMYGHLNVARLPPGYPQFFARAEGCHPLGRRRQRLCRLHVRLRADGAGLPATARSRQPRAAQRALGDCMNGPVGAPGRTGRDCWSAPWPHADWALFQKNGTDATTLCVTIARAATGKRKMLVARGAYHGAAPWCTPIAGRRRPPRTAPISCITTTTTSTAWRPPPKARGGDLAARHRLGLPARLRQRPGDCRPGLRAAARADSAMTPSAALILDDVRAGFRLDLGGSWEPLGVRPDLAAYSQGDRQRLPLAAVTGSDRFRDAATTVFIDRLVLVRRRCRWRRRSKTLEILRRDNAIARMATHGQIACATGSTRRRRSHGLGAAADRSGADADRAVRRRSRLSRRAACSLGEALRGGV